MNDAPTHGKACPLTKASIILGLRELGVRPGMGIEVHSSLSSFGYVEGGAKTVINALMEVVGEIGTIVMPSFLLSKPLPLTEGDHAHGLTAKIRLLDPASGEPTGMGIIADTFRRRSDTITGEGVFRVTAWGRYSAINSQGFRHLIDEDQWALLLGVDIYRLSTMHYVEEHLPDVIRNLYQAPKEILKRYPQDQWYVETGVPAVKAWYKIQEQAYANGSIHQLTIGKSQCMLFKINDVIGLYKQALMDDPYGLYGVER